MGLSNLPGRTNTGSMLSGLSVAAIVIILFRDCRQPRPISICDPGSLERCQSRIYPPWRKLSNYGVISSLLWHWPQDSLSPGTPCTRLCAICPPHVLLLPPARPASCPHYPCQSPLPDNLRDSLVPACLRARCRAWRGADQHRLARRCPVRSVDPRLWRCRDSQPQPGVAGGPRWWMQHCPNSARYFP
jgi:hypothetical protein